AAEWFLERGARAVLVKAGHRAGRPRDLLVQAGKPPLWIEGEWVQAFRRSGVQAFRRSGVRAHAEYEGSGVHGTGCVLAAVVAAPVAAAAFAGGAAAVQLREKRLATPALVALARELAARASEAGVLFLVNDRIDVALAAGADGAHVGPDDMAPADARRVLGPDRLLGVSVGTVE